MLPHEEGSSRAEYPGLYRLATQRSADQQGQSLDRRGGTERGSIPYATHVCAGQQGTEHHRSLFTAICIVIAVPILHYFFPRRSVAFASVRQRFENFSIPRKQGNMVTAKGQHMDGASAILLSSVLRSLFC